MSLTGLNRQAGRPVFGPTNRRAVHLQPSLGRREVLQLGIALPFLASKPALADGPEVTAPVAEVPVEPLVPSSPETTATKAAELYLDLDFQLLPPASFKFVDTQPAYDPNRRGPAPPPSPVRARFDSPDGSTVLSVVVRNAQTIRQSILQVTDVSVFGDLEEVAKLLLPRGSRVLSASTLQVLLPPKQTALGLVEVPPKNYYRRVAGLGYTRSRASAPLRKGGAPLDTSTRPVLAGPGLPATCAMASGFSRYEFTTANGLHAVMTTAAMKGRVFVCGGTTSAGQGWDQYGAALREATESFRLRSDNVVL